MSTVEGLSHVCVHNALLNMLLSATIACLLLAQQLLKGLRSSHCHCHCDVTVIFKSGGVTRRPFAILDGMHHTW
jgi:hypothetical protein